MRQWLPERKRALNDISRSARSVRSTTFAAEVDGRQRDITRFGTDWQHARAIGTLPAADRGRFIHLLSTAYPQVRRPRLQQLQ
ncbi:hypothetical protein CO666_31635 [Rhizobium chutanense]|uniref:Uncharacterized protein n=1 Tax=Rhizobium chutanense TaxID=2035448 RepID=A0A2A6J2M0_9HYPH|nr:hypothetical protein CO666_31635 [Rhizobium chutanense]